MRASRFSRRAVVPVLVLFTVFFSVPAMAGPFIAKIEGLKNNEGQVRCGLYSQQDGWRDETRAQHTINAPIQNGTAVCNFGHVTAGRYGLAVFHAEQNETQVSYGLLGKPKQGVGFSNNPSIAFGPPGFDKAAFSLGDAGLELAVQIRY